MSLSNSKVIETLNRYFIPVYISNEDYRDGGSAPKEEVAELRRIHQEGYAAKLSVGTVHAFVLSPEGRLLHSMHVVEAAKADKLLPMLNSTVKALSVKGGDPVVRPTVQSAAAAPPGTLLLHVVARYLERKGSEYVPTSSSGGDWTAFAGEDWIRLAQPQWLKLLPPPTAKPGDSWEIDRSVAGEIASRLYPPTENNDLSKNRIDALSLKATVLSVDGDRVRARLDGSFKMQHAFYHKEDGRFVEGMLVGTLEAEPRKKRITALRLVTDQAFYRPGSSQPYGAAVELM